VNQPAAPAVPADLVERVRSRLASTSEPLTAQAVAAALRSDAGPVGQDTVLAVHARLLRDVAGAGPLEDLLALPGVTDVLVNGAGAVHVDRGAGLEPTSVRFADEDQVRRLAQRLASLGGRRLDEASPCVDLRLPDGTRFHAVLSPIASPGTAISLRVPPRRAFPLARLVSSGSMPAPVGRLLSALVAARAAFLVTGGTGSGKTTVLATLLGLVPPTERIVVVEDAAELRPDHPHVVSLEARPANLEGAGALDLRTLVRQALRMRPDRLVVGEVRGAEVVEMLAALNTGHEGGCGTLHANSATDVPARIEALALAAGLDRAAAHSQLAAGIDAVVHLRRGRDGVRRVEEVAVPVRAPDGTVAMRSAVRVEEGRVLDGPGADRLAGVLERA
jgi:pilus assembly protein CpaF